MVPLDGCTLKRRLSRLDRNVLHEAWREGWTARLHRQLGLNVDALLKKYPFKQGVLVSEHQTFVGRRAMTLLESRQRLLILLDRRLKLLDVLGPALSEGSLRLSVALLTLFRRSVDRFASTFTLLRLGRLIGILRAGFLLRRRFHGARRAIARCFNLANGRADLGSSIVASSGDVAAAGVVIAHLQVPGMVGYR